jgi:CMP-N-acetylneuraminic acid synthetase
MTKKVLAVVCARAGSKRLPDKNIQRLGDRTLVEFAFEAANLSGFITHRCVTTDCPKVMEIARGYDFDVIQRPKELAGDNSDIADAAVHAMSQYSGIEFDYVVTLQAAVPLRPFGAIDALINGVIINRALGGLTCVPVHPWFWRLGNKKPTWWNVDAYPRTQDLSEKYVIEVNSIQVAPGFIAQAGFRWRYPAVFLELPEWANYDIDTWDDLENCRRKWEIDQRIYNEPRIYNLHYQEMIAGAQCSGGYCEMCPQNLPCNSGK